VRGGFKGRGDNCNDKKVDGPFIVVTINFRDLLDWNLAVVVFIPR
jgi:hypothetical protein